MPDWNPLLAERLGHLTLAQEMREEVVNELATHLEEHYQELRAHGVSDSESVSVALSQVVDWEALGRKIIEAKNEGERMNDRTKQFWLPGLVTLTATMLWLMFLQRLNWRPQTAFVHGSPPLMPYLIWLLTQPVFGAAGAYLSRCAGGNRIARIASGIFPSIGMFGLLFFVGLTAALVEKNTFVLSHPYYSALILLPWVVFPAITLLLGVVPFLTSASEA